MTKHMKPQPLADIKNRIATATEQSPIAVFIINRDNLSGLSAVFASTISTRQLIKNNHPDLVGVFHKNYDLKEVAITLNSAL